MNRRVLALSLAALALGACAYVGGRVPPYRPPAYYPPPPEQAAGAEVGRFLYGRDCAFCHGSQGQGTERGPSLQTAGNGAALTDFMLRSGRMPINDENEPTRRRDSPYSEEQITAIVEFVVSEFDPPGPDIPEVDLAAGDISTGQRLYQRHCASCHATTGIGGAMLTQREGAAAGGTAGVIIPDLDGATPVEVAESVRAGPGNMPRFGPGVISDEELDAVVAYVSHLQAPGDPGGASIGRIGPFSEGAVGWLVGLGSLVVFIYWVGTKIGEEP